MLGRYQDGFEGVVRAHRVESCTQEQGVGRLPDDQLGVSMGLLAPGPPNPALVKVTSSREQEACCAYPYKGVGPFLQTEAMFFQDLGCFAWPWRAGVQGTGHHPRCSWAPVCMAAGLTTSSIHLISISQVPQALRTQNRQVLVLPETVKSRLSHLLMTGRQRWTNPSAAQPAMSSPLAMPQVSCSTGRTAV